MPVSLEQIAAATDKPIVIAETSTVGTHGIDKGMFKCLQLLVLACILILHMIVSSAPALLLLLLLMLFVLTDF
jgi:hypothetical protein